MESRIVVKRIAFRARGGGARRSVPDGFRNFSITSVIFNATEFVPDRWRRSNLAGQKPVVRERREGVDTGDWPFASASTWLQGCELLRPQRLSRRIFHNHKPEVVSK